MRRTNSTESARTRRLSDDEIRAVWKVAEGNGVFRALVRLLRPTAQRDKVVSMRWQDISMDGVWTIPTEAREKGNAVELVPKLALDIVRAQPQFANNPYVLTGRGDGHINGFGKGKLAFDEKVACQAAGCPAVAIARPAANRSLADEPRWRVERSCRTRHGPQD